MKNIKMGMHHGIPIALGYFSVSFTFGLMGVSAGFAWWQVVLISMLNITSAGQFAGLDIMIAGGSLLEMALSQFIINIRYALMSLSLSQKVERTFKTTHRIFLSAGITDEIFAVAMSQPHKITSSYFLGLFFVPYIGWSGGTAVGALAGGILPVMVRECLGIAIYGMFLAIILPKARENRAYLFVILLAVGMSCGFAVIPVLNKISSGFVIIICAVFASAMAAWKYPLKEESGEVQGKAEGKEKMNGGN